jgi:delta14-sterol reductase
VARRLGAAGITFGLPILLYIFAFGCNDISGCPAPSLLSPKTLSLETLKAEVGWPEDGIRGLVTWEAMGWTLAYYLFSAVLYTVLPAQDVEGTELASGGRLMYRLNGELSSKPPPARVRLLQNAYTNP